MKYISKALIPAVVFFICQSLLIHTPLKATDSSYDDISYSFKLPLIDVPETISKEAQDTLIFFNTLIQQNNQKLFSGMPSPEDLEGWKAKFEENEGFLDGLNKEVVAQYSPSEINDVILGGVRAVEIIPQDYEPQQEVIVYIHGGGFTLNSARKQLIGAVPIADISKKRVVIIDYETAPFVTHSKILAQVVSVISNLKQQGLNVAVYGDSAGANLAAAATLKMRDDGVMPEVLVLMSPWLDLTGSGDTYTSLELQDPILSAEALELCALAYAPKEEHAKPLISPIFGNFHDGFPPTLIQCGKKEMLLSDSLRFFRALQEANQEALITVREGMWHCHQIFSWTLPESIQALEEAVDFILTNFN